MVDHDVVVVGAGFSGLNLLKLLRDHGYRTVVLEAGPDIGGTWYWNRYPGLRCDVESMMYSYSFSDEIQAEWNWSHRYGAQPEILKYIHYVADKLNLRKDIVLNSRVKEAHYDPQSRRWKIVTEAGTRYSASFCVMATGCLSVPHMPNFEGLSNFGGEWYHTGQWPETPVCFEGKRVGVIGTGSSGIQSIPIIAEQAKHLTVFQRTPNYSIPAWNVPLSPERARAWRQNYKEFRRVARTTNTGDIFQVPNVSALAVNEEERANEYERRWRDGSFGFLAAYNDLLTDDAANRTAQEFFRRKIRERVKDPKTAELLCPKEHLGTKRMCVDTDYFETYNRDNVELVDLRSTPFVKITKQGIQTTAQNYPLDIIVFATGYDAMTGALMRVNIRGREGRSLAAEWANGPRTYLGLAVAGFPNLFIVAGPQSPSVLSNMLTSIEQHAEWIVDCLSSAREGGYAVIEASEKAQQRWVAHCDEVAAATLFPQATSWFLGSNIEGKPRTCLALHRRRRRVWSHLRESSRGKLQRLPPDVIQSKERCDHAVCRGVSFACGATVPISSLRPNLVRVHALCNWRTLFLLAGKMTM